jgi:hypothetical protein
VFDNFVKANIEKYKSLLQKDTESFKNSLNIEAERFKYELNTLSIEHQIRYSKLYEERGQVIKRIYNLLVDLETSLAELTTLFQGPEWIEDTQRENKTRLSIHELKRYLEYNRIFFNEGLCLKIESILSDSHNISIEMALAKISELRNQKYNKQGIEISVDELSKPSNTWHVLDEKVQKEINAARLELAQEFRSLIGVS